MYLIDIDTDIPAYQARGDAEIGRVHPFDGVVTIWTRRPDGTYGETDARTGSIELSALPGIAIDLDRLFNR